MIRPRCMALLALFGAGCASYSPPLDAGIRFTSVPSGAGVRIEGGYYGRTPVTVNLTRERDYAVTFHAEGYQDGTYRFSLRNRSVHGVLSPSATRAIADTATSGTRTVNHARGSIPGVRLEPVEGTRVLVREDAPVTVTLTDGSTLAANRVEPATFGIVKVFLTSGETKYAPSNRIKSIMTREPADWTKAVLEEGKSVPPR